MVFGSPPGPILSVLTGSSPDWTIWTGLAFPPDFPRGELDFLHRYISGRNPEPEKPPRWKEWTDGINGHVYRFLACDEHVKAVCSSLKAESAPPFPERYKQEKWLFAFFYEGLSALECLFYALYFLGAHVDPETFALDARRQDITPRFVTKRFETRFGKEALTAELRATLDDEEYGNWLDIRNILSHRGHGGRTVYAGGPRSRQSDWNLPISEAQATAILDPAELERRRAWLGERVARILKAAHTFGTSEIS